MNGPSRKVQLYLHRIRFDGNEIRIPCTEAHDPVVRKGVIVHWKRRNGFFSLRKGQLTLQWANRGHEKFANWESKLISDYSEDCDDTARLLSCYLYLPAARQDIRFEYHTDLIYYRRDAEYREVPSLWQIVNGLKENHDITELVNKLNPPQVRRRQAPKPTLVQRANEVLLELHQSIFG